MIPALDFAERLLRRIEERDQAARERLLQGGCAGFDAYRELAGRHRAFEECAELVREMLSQLLDEPLSETVKRVTR